MVLHEKFAIPQDKEDQGCFYVTSKTHASGVVHDRK
jgi:hypothetical protein